MKVVKKKKIANQTQQAANKAQLISDRISKCTAK